MRNILILLRVLYSGFINRKNNGLRFYRLKDSWGYWKGANYSPWMIHWKYRNGINKYK